MQNVKCKMQNLFSALRRFVGSIAHIDPPGIVSYEFGPMWASAPTEFSENVHFAFCIYHRAFCIYLKGILCD